MSCILKHVIYNVMHIKASDHEQVHQYFTILRSNNLDLKDLSWQKSIYILIVCRRQYIYTGDHRIMQFWSTDDTQDVLKRYPESRHEANTELHWFLLSWGQDRVALISPVMRPGQSCTDFSCHEARDRVALISPVMKPGQSCIDFSCHEARTELHWFLLSWGQDRVALISPVMRPGYSCIDFSCHEARIELHWFLPS